MQRSESLLRVWPWLPAFRVVAETQHLSEAAASLDITPAALSRTVAKLESALGTRLFDRVHRGMVLTAEGAHLSHQVRDLMRLMDDALTTLSPSRLEAKWVRVVFDGHAIGALLHHQLERLMRGKARLSFEAAPVAKMAASLLSGEVDLGFATAPSNDDRIVCKPLGEVACRWATLDQTLKMPPMGPVADLATQPSVAPISPVVLRHAAMLLPTSVALPAGTRRASASAMTVWRLTRTRPTRLLLSLSSTLMSQ